MAQEEVLGLTFWKPVLLKSVQPASFFFFRIWFLIFAFSYSLLKVLTMMGMGREMIRTPQMAQVAPHSFPNQVLTNDQSNSVLQFREVRGEPTLV